MSIPKLRKQYNKKYMPSLNSIVFRQFLYGIKESTAKCDVMHNPSGRILDFFFAFAKMGTHIEFDLFFWKLLYMQTLISNFSKRLRQVYQRAEEFIEEEREFALSQVFLNATFKRYVTDNVRILQDLHADLHEDWLRLYATLEVKGLHTTLSVDLKLIQMELNQRVQLVVFEQISETQVVEARFKNWFQKVGFYAAIFFYQKILKEDPLGKILEKYQIVRVQDELLYLDLNRWMGKSRSVIETLGKVHINHARLRETELVILGNVNLAALLNKMSNMASDADSFDLRDSQVSPIQQK